MKQTNPYEKLDNSPIHLLHRAGQCAGDVFFEEMSDGDLTPRQYAVLLTVARHEGLSQTELVERTGIDRSTLADIIRRMLKKGLLQRQRTKRDARAYAVRLTDTGRGVLDSASPAAAHADERILATLSPKQRDQFIEALNKIVSSSEGQVSPEASLEGGM
ncbi:MAG: MarR family transcriptional regulator [Hyphomicrobiaceae bacterium]